MTSSFNRFCLVAGRTFFTLLVLLLLSPALVFAQAMIVEDFESYRPGALSSPWKTVVTSTGDKADSGSLAVVNSLAAWGRKSLEVSGTGSEAYYERSLQKQDVLLKFDIYLPAGLDFGEVAGRVAYSGLKVVFMMDHGGVYRAFCEEAPTVAISGFTSEKWYEILVRVDYDEALAQIESSGLASEVFSFSLDETGGLGSDMSLLGGKGMHVDAITLKASYHDYLIDSDGDGDKDYLDPDDDNDGLDDDRDSYPLDANLLFLETWEQGFSPALWKSLGTSQVAVVQEAGRQGGGAFDSGGNSQASGGVLSSSSFNLSARPELSFWLRGQGSKTYWQNVKVGWSYLGGSGNALNSLVSFTAQPEKSSKSFQYCVLDDCFSEPWLSEEHDDTWVYVKISLNPNGTASFTRDGQIRWTSRFALDLDDLPLQRIELSGQSYQDAQLLDDIAVSLPDPESSRYPDWRRWEGLSGMLDKPLNLERSNQGRYLVETREGKVPASFYTDGQKWLDNQLEFDFKITNQADLHAPAFFYRAESFGEHSQVKVQLHNGELHVYIGEGEQLTELASMIYAFKPGLKYHCKIDLKQEKMMVYQEDSLIASSITPPTHLEAQRLSNANRLLLVWLTPDNEAFSHIRIYRSTAPDQKGNLLADKVVGMTFVDDSVTTGTTYFYKLYAVDRAGREMRKFSPLTVFRFGNSAPYRPFIDMPDAGNGRHVLASKDTVVTIPLVLSAKEMKSYLRGKNTPLMLDPSTNQWRDAKTLEPGRGYFVQSKAMMLDVVGEPLPEQPFDLPLLRGWNVIGNPFLKPVDVPQLSVTVDGQRVTLQSAVEKGWVADYFYGYVDGKWYVTSVFEVDASLPPWRGVYLLAAKDAVLHVPFYD